MRPVVSFLAADMADAGLSDAVSCMGRNKADQSGFPSACRVSVRGYDAFAVGVRSVPSLCKEHILRHFDRFGKTVLFEAVCKDRPELLVRSACNVRSRYGAGDL